MVEVDWTEDRSGLPDMILYTQTRPIFDPISKARLNTLLSYMIASTCCSHYLAPVQVSGLFVFVLHYVQRPSLSVTLCRNLYGVPNYRDCLSAWHSMFALESRDSYNPKRYGIIL